MSDMICSWDGLGSYGRYGAFIWEASFMMGRGLSFTFLMGALPSNAYPHSGQCVSPGVTMFPHCGQKKVRMLSG